MAEDGADRKELNVSVMLHLLEFKSDFSQWFVLLFA